MVRFQIHDWTVNCKVVKKAYRDFIEDRFRHYIINPTDRGKVKYDFNLTIGEKLSDRQITARFSGDRFSKVWLENYCLLVTDLVKPEAYIVHQDKVYIDIWTLFLAPFCSLLKSGRGATLMHAAFISQNKKGTLILGPSGAGKTSISTICTLAGFKFYSDEHPIIYRSQGKVFGKSLATPVAIKSNMIDQFPEVAGFTHWDKHRQKHGVSIWDAVPGCLGNTCEITNTIFPKFSSNSKLKIFPLSPEEMLEKSMQDIVWVPSFVTKRLRKITMDIHKIYMDLSRKTKGFEIRYSEKNFKYLPSIIENLSSE